MHLLNVCCFYVMSLQINVQTHKKSAHPSLSSKVLKNKALLCKPLVQNKGVSCKTQTVDCEAQTGKSNTYIPLTLVVPRAILICRNKEQIKQQNDFYPPINTVEFVFKWCCVSTFQFNQLPPSYMYLWSSCTLTLSSILQKMLFLKSWLYLSQCQCMFLYPWTCTPSVRPALWVCHYR